MGKSKDQAGGGAGELGDADMEAVVGGLTLQDSSLSRASASFAASASFKASASAAVLGDDVFGAGIKG